MKRLGILASTDELERLKSAASAPYLVMAGREPVDPVKLAHRMALDHGLPEIDGYYGCDLETGEFLSS